MSIQAGVSHVVYDPERSQFRGRVYLTRNGTLQAVSASVPGRLSWSHARVQRALIANAAEARHDPRAAFHASR